MIGYSGMLAMCYGMIPLVLLSFFMILPNGCKGMLSFVVGIVCRLPGIVDCRMRVQGESVVYR